MRGAAHRFAPLDLARQEHAIAGGERAFDQILLAHGPAQAASSPRAAMR